jgi:hypothetical protein
VNNRDPTSTRNAVRLDMASLSIRESVNLGISETSYEEELLKICRSLPSATIASCHEHADGRKPMPAKIGTRTDAADSLGQDPENLGIREA